MYEQDNTGPRAAVVDTAGRVHLPGRLSRIKIRGSDLPSILYGAAHMATHSTIVVDGVAVAEHAQFSDQARRDGWDHHAVGPWTLYHRADGRTVAVGLRAEFGPRHLGVLIDQGDDPALLALLLDRYATLTGINWRGTPATTALAKIRLTWENSPGSPRWNFRKVGPGYATGPLIWSRPLTELQASWGYVHTFDASSAYLGSAGNAELAWSVLETTGPRTFDKHIPGYWHIVLDPLTLAWCADPNRPPLITPARIRDGAAWLTTPMVWMLRELGHPIQIRATWTASQRNGHRRGHRVLRQFAEQLRDARRDAPTDRLRYAIKRTYKDATGGMQREGMRIYRPDWAHTLIDLWRVTLLRRIIKVHETQGIWPCEVKTDSVSYPDCIEHPQPRGATRHLNTPTLTDALNVQGCELPGCSCSYSPPGRFALGTYKHEATTTAEQWTEDHAPKARTSR